MKKKANVVTKRAIEELGEFVKSASKQIAVKSSNEPSPIAEAMQQKSVDGDVNESDQIAIDRERLRRLEEEMEIIRKERKERDAKRKEENEIARAHIEEAKKMDQSAITPARKELHYKKGPHIPSTGELIKKRN